MTVSWDPPLEPNGIILVYEVTVEGSSNPRNKRAADMTIIGRTAQNVSNTTTSVNITNLGEWRGVMWSESVSDVVGLCDMEGVCVDGGGVDL